MKMLVIGLSLGIVLSVLTGTVGFLYGQYFIMQKAEHALAVKFDTIGDKFNTIKDAGTTALRKFTNKGDQ